MEHMNQIPLLSIIIPTRHRNSLLAQCLGCLATEVQTAASHLYEVIVTDDGDRETAEEMIKTDFPSVRWIKGPVKGPAANRNNGRRVARGTWLAFVDDDCIPGAGWVQGYLDAIRENSGYRVFEGKTVADRDQIRFNEDSPVNMDGGNLWSCNLMIEAAYYDQIGGFCEDFPFELEDQEFRTRIRKDKQPYLFVHEAEVCHPWRRVVKRDAIAAESILTYLRHHPDHKGYYTLGTRLKILLPRLVTMIPRAIRFRFRGVGYELKHIFYELMVAVVVAHRMKEIPAAPLMTPYPSPHPQI